VVHGFADNLIVTRIGCMTELDTTEVIMNSFVKAPEASDFPKMHLAVVVDDNHMESTFHYSSTSLKIVFVNPYTPEEFNEDLQFIMEVEGPAEFSDGGAIGCEGNRRVSARLKDANGMVQLTIHDSSASLRVWAGWATGHNAVRLTPNLLLEPHSGGGDTNNAAHDTAKGDEEVSKEHEKPKSKDTKGEPEALERAKKKGAKGDVVPPPPNEASKVARSDEDGDMDVQEERKMAHLKNKQKSKRKKRNKYPTEEEEERLKNKQKSKKRDNKQKSKNRDKSPTEEERQKRNIKVNNKKDFIATAQELKTIHADSAVTKDTNSTAADSATDYDDVTQDEEKLEPIKHKRGDPLKKQQQDQGVEKRLRKELEAQMKRNFPDTSFRGRYEKGVSLDMSSHFYACAFFVFAMGSLLIVIGKRREKGRRDL
jgi:hypothetical protein